MDKKSVKPLKELLDSMRENRWISHMPKMKTFYPFPNPPFYTACPNPYIKEFIEEYGTHYNYQRMINMIRILYKNISEGKNDEIYRAHNYHTKVPS